MTESTHVLDVTQIEGEDSLATIVANNFQSWKSRREQWETEKRELRNYIFATDTSKTTNSQLPWKNSTTLPKIAQIRDNLHANYMAALFPNEDWFVWQADSKDDQDINKAKAITAYMKNKMQQSEFRNEVSRLVNDYIDYGNAFAEVVFDSEYHETEQGDIVVKNIGPRLQRISPFDIVFDITAPNWHRTPKITRTLTSFGRLRKQANIQAGAGWITEALDRAQSVRNTLTNSSGVEIAKSEALSIDGFSSITEYFQSGYIEVLEFEGDIYDQDTDTLWENRRIIVIDRLFVAFNQPYDSWLGRSNKEHVGWRQRPDNLMAMGPLDNLVGMQYRIDHLENLKADVFDQIAHPVVYQRGYVEDWDWGPGERIFGDEESSVQILAPDATALNADFQIANLQDQMEEFAGAPRQAMGFRTPGEKTAFEVQTLENAAGRIFQNKISHFEDVFLEPLLNQMLEAARRYIDKTDIVRVMDDDFGVIEFLNVTPDDIKATGRLVPIGARHFARQNQLAQNLLSFTSSPAYADPSVVTHISGLRVAKVMEELTGLDKFELVRPNVRVIENQETAATAQSAQGALAAEGAVGPESFIEDGAAGVPEV